MFDVPLNESQADDEIEVPANDNNPNTTSDQVIERIEDVIKNIAALLGDNKLPELRCNKYTKTFTLMGSRSVTSILLVLSFCHSLLTDRRTTTTREVYYVFVTHFRNQRECDVAIWDAAALLGVSRIALGLTASPKGWYCGCLTITNATSDLKTDAMSLTSAQGLPITKEWLEKQKFRLTSTAHCILVIEKEGIYHRLSEDRFFDRYPCILITGKGFPDLATRAMVHVLHNELGLPVYGICDCNPFGMGVLQTYEFGSTKLGLDGGDRYSVPIKWLGLRPTHVEGLKSNDQLPPDTFQQLTEKDLKKLESMTHETHAFHQKSEARLDELVLMQEKGYKMELEALHWMGMDFLCDWVEDILVRHHHKEEGLII